MVRAEALATASAAIRRMSRTLFKHLKFAGVTIVTLAEGEISSFTSA